MIYEDGEMVEGGESAEVSAAPESPETVTEDSSSEVSDSSESDGITEVSAEAEAPAQPEYSFPEFDFDGWDGQLDGLHEAYRPIYENVSGRLKKDMDGLRNSLEQDRELYQALLEGEDIGKDFQQKLQAAQKELAKREETQGSWEEEKAKYEDTIKRFEGRFAQVEATEKLDAENWARDFRKANEDVMGDDTKRSQVVKFLDAGIDPEVAVDFVRSGDQNYIRTALGYMAQGVPNHFAVRLAKTDVGRSETEAAPPRASAQMTAGASETVNVPQSAEKSVTDKTFNIRDARRIAVERAFKGRTG